MMRVDVLVKEKYGLSRQKVQQLVKEGAVRADGRTVSKPSQQVEETAEIEILSDADILKYVGRGGLKLEGAVKAFGLELSGLVCIDIGASTGGFTDCMLQNGAERVYAVDVGTAQLVPSLKEDSRVVCCENTNILDFECPESVDFIAVDVSFVSLAKIFPKIARLLAGNTAVVLVKPQFEAGREHLSKKGIVRDLRVHKNVLSHVISAAEQCGLYFSGLVVSPVKGGDGNTEYLLLLKRQNELKDIKRAVEDVINEAKKL